MIKNLVLGKRRSFGHYAQALLSPRGNFPIGSQYRTSCPQHRRSFPTDTSSSRPAFMTAILSCFHGKWNPLNSHSLSQASQLPESRAPVPGPQTKIGGIVRSRGFSPAAMPDRSVRAPEGACRDFDGRRRLFDNPTTEAAFPQHGRQEFSTNRRSVWIHGISSPRKWTLSSLAGGELVAAFCQRFAQTFQTLTFPPARLRTKETS